MRVEYLDNWGRARCVLLWGYFPRKCSRDFLKKAVPNLNIKKIGVRGTCVAESVKLPTSAHDMIWCS